MITGRRWLLGGCAVAGAVLAHTIVYALVHPDPSARASHLAASGHGYWPAALAVAGLAAVAAAAAVVVRAAAPGWKPVRATGFGSRLVRLTACQLALFVVMELSEGVFTGRASPALASHPEFLLGLLLQVVVAAAILVVLGMLERTAERLAVLRVGPPARRPRAVHPRFARRRTPRTALRCAARPRGPPALVRA